MGDRIAVLNFGRLQQFDTPDNLYKHPDNVFVAGFIGSPSMNLFEMRIGTSDGRMMLRGEQFSLPVSDEDAAALRAFGGPSVTVGIRPEHVIDRSLDGRLPAEAVVKTTVDVVETLGAEQYVYLDTGAAEPLVARMPPDLALSHGSSLEVVLPPDRLHFFDPATGNAIAEREEAKTLTS